MTSGRHFSRETLNRFVRNLTGLNLVPVGHHNGASLFVDQWQHRREVLVKLRRLTDQQHLLLAGEALRAARIVSPSDLLTMSGVSMWTQSGVQ